MPLSTQWDKAGYYYPTQIAQYGLSHWSKHVPLRVASVASTSSPADSDATPPLTRTVYENGAEDILGNWHGDTTRVTSQVLLVRLWKSRNIRQSEDKFATPKVVGFEFRDS